MLSKYKYIFILVSRLIVGGIFIAAGWMKVSDMAMTVGLFSQMGFPAFLAYLVSYVEVVGGILIILGLYIETASVVLSVVMLVAIYKTSGLGFQGMMAPLAVLSSLLLFIDGAGTIAIGSDLHKRRRHHVAS